MARHAVSSIIFRAFGGNFPFGTITVNALGCFLIGFLAGLEVTKLHFSLNAKLFLIVGILGGFTTFSAFILETANLIKSGETLLALANVFASVFLGFFIFQCGVILGEAF